MVKEIITFGDIEIEKHKFQHNESPILLDDVGIKNECIWLDFFW